MQILDRDLEGTFMKHTAKYFLVLAVAAGIGGCAVQPYTFEGGLTGDGGPDASGGGGEGGAAGGGGSGGGTIEPKLLQIVVSPHDSLVELDLGKGGSVKYAASGKYEGGTEKDLSDVVTWSHSNLEVGSFASGSNLALAPQSTVGTWMTVVTAEHEGVQGSARLSVVSYRKTGPEQDFFFVLPYMDEAGPQERMLEFGTDVPKMDVFFNMDTTGSMGGSILGLKTSLTKTIIPQVQEQIPDTQFGTGEFQDFPISPYGATTNQPFRLGQAITPDGSAVLTAVSGYTAGGGNDPPESMIESLYQIATGEGLSGPSPTLVAPNKVGVGGVGFREGTMRVVVTITDAPSHTVDEASNAYIGAVAKVAHTRQQAKDALAAICGRFVGVSVQNGDFAADADTEDFAIATGSMIPPVAWDSGRPTGCNPGQCCTAINGAGRVPGESGLCPLVFQTASTGSGLGESITTGLKMLSRYATFEVITEKDGETKGENGKPLPAGKTTADLIRSIKPESYTMPPSPPMVPPPVISPTSFLNVTPGTRVLFSVRAFNDFVTPTSEAQFFRAVIRVLAGGCAALDSREVIIMVPPAASSG